MKLEILDIKNLDIFGEIGYSYYNYRFGVRCILLRLKYMSLVQFFLLVDAVYYIRILCSNRSVTV